MTKQNWESVIDGIQTFMIWFLIAIISVCILSLILFDVLVGAGVMLYLTNNSIPASIFISLATSGLLMSLMVIAYTLQTGEKKKSSVGVGLVVGILALSVYCLDVYFDCLTADYLRFGKIISLSETDNTQLLFRMLIGGISTVGESLAVSIILGMPVLKNIIGNALPHVKSSRPETKKYTPKKTYTPNQDLFRNVPKAKKRKF